MGCPKSCNKGEADFISAFAKKARLETYQTQIEELKELEHQHKQTTDPVIPNQIKEVRKKGDISIWKRRKGKLGL